MEVSINYSMMLKVFETRACRGGDTNTMKIVLLHCLHVKSVKRL